MSTRRSVGALLLALVTTANVLGLVAGAEARGATTQEATAQEGDGAPVHVVEISGTIDLGLAPYLDRALDEAEDAGAELVVVEVDTPGGRLDAVVQMRDALLDSPVPTVALVDASALSAGALVALACGDIAMTPGSVMGAATPVEGGTGEIAGEKVVSAVRAMFEATAEERGRDPRIAGAMVDADVAVDGLVGEGDLLTLTVAEAREHGYADLVVSDRSALLDELGLVGREVVSTGPSLAEETVRFLTNPVVASLLVTLGVWLVFADLLSGGVGIAAAVGVALLAVFFGGHMLAGLAGWEDVALVTLGLVLIAVELLVVPGFGVPGVLGLVALLGGAFLAMLYRDFDFVTDAQLLRAGAGVGLSLVAIVAGLVAMLAFLTRRGSRSGLVLRAHVGAGTPVTERAGGGWLRWLGGTAVLERERSATDDGAERQPDAAESDAAEPDAIGSRGTEPGGGGPMGSLVGATGTALSDLRPSGVAEIEQRRVDVVTEGEYVARGEAVEVVRDEGYRRVVRRRGG